MVLWEAFHITLLYYLGDLGLVTTPSHALASVHILFPRVNQQWLSQTHVPIIPTKSSALILSLLFYCKPLYASFLPP